MGSSSTIPATVHEVNKVLKDQGFSTVLILFLLTILAYLAYLQTNQLTEQVQTWQKVRTEDLNNLRESLDVERSFIRTKLLETLKENREATKNHTEAIRELTSSLRQSRLSD